jgi:hypothetical protein
MSPAGNVAAASGLGAAGGAFAGFLLAFVGGKIAGAGPKHAGIAALLGTVVGAVVGAASVGAYEEKRVLGAGAPLSDAVNKAIGAGLVFADGDYPVPDPFHHGCVITLHCTTVNGKQVCTSTSSCP